MRVVKTIGATVTVLGLAGLAFAWAPAIGARQDKPGQTPAAAAPRAAGDQQQGQKAAVPPTAGEHRVIVRVDKAAGGQPEVVTIQRTIDAALGGGGPRLGVQIRDIEGTDVATLKLTGPNGAVIEDVMKDSAADKAGAKKGDVVVQFDGENVRGAQQLTRLVRETPAGRTVKMALVRGGKRVELNVTPQKPDDSGVNVLIPDADEIRREVEEGVAGSDPMARHYMFERRLPAPGEPHRMPGPPVPGEEGPIVRQFRFRGTPPGADRFWFDDGAAGMMLERRGRLGVTVQELESELADYFGVKTGLLVSTVRKDSPAAKAGIKAGDVITSVSDTPVSSTSDLIDQLRDKEGDVTVGVVRDRKPLSLKATLEAKPQPVKPRIPAPGKPA